MKPLTITLLALLVAACSRPAIDSTLLVKQPPVSAPGFVGVDEELFVIDGVPWFPLMLNYKVDWRRLNDTVVISPAYYYDNPEAWEASSAEGTLAQFRRHAQLSAQAGFNSLRVCLDVTGSDSQGRYYGNGDDPVYLLRDSAAIFRAVDWMAREAAAEGLRLMLLIPKDIDGEIDAFVAALLRHCADNPTIWAYDFFNEPLYFDPVEKRDKLSAYQQVLHWRTMMRQNAPNQLFTVALSEPIEVFEWDATLLPVDFVEMHTYHPLRVASEMYWYSRNHRYLSSYSRPWMVGETGLPADNDSVPYALQSQFFDETMRLAIVLDAAGYGWWEFQDNPQHPTFEAQYTGIFYWDGSQLVAKPVVQLMMAADTLLRESGRQGDEVLRDSTLSADLRDSLWQDWFYRVEGTAIEPAPPMNYGNMLAYSNLVITGQIVSPDGPVVDAVVRGWNDDWSVGVNTFTDKEGRFTLYSNDYCVHFEVSAPGMSHLKFDRRGLHYTPKPDSLPERTREYQQIDYRPLLASDTAILLFRPEAFQPAAAQADMGTLKLKPLPQH